MKPTVIFIEGLPGSGKTTYAKKLYEHYESIGLDVKMYMEGDLHPLDLAWCSITTRETFRELVKKYSKYEFQIQANTKVEEDIYITAYTKIKVMDEDVELYRDFEQYEIYRIDDIDGFRKSHIDLWKHFNDEENHNDIYIFECIFLQNHINEMILKHNMSLIQMQKYFQDLISTLSNFNVKLFYIKQANIAETLERVASERRWKNPHYKDWIDLVIEYFEKSKFGAELGYLGYDGVIKYFKNRQGYELEIIPTLKIDSHIYELEDNYERIFNMIKKVKLESV